MNYNEKQSKKYCVGISANELLLKLKFVEQFITRSSKKS